MSTTAQNETSGLTNVQAGTMASSRRVGCQHLGQFSVLQAAVQELCLCQAAIIVVVHLRKNGLCSFLGCVYRFDGSTAQHLIDSLYNLGHLLDINYSITIHIIHPEGPFEFFLWISSRCNVDGEEKLLEVDGSALVCVEGPEDVIAELLGVATWEEELVHVNELGGTKGAIGAVLTEPLVPLLDGGLVVASVGLEELHVLFRQTVLFAGDATHVESISLEMSVMPTTVSRANHFLQIT